MKTKIYALILVFLYNFSSSFAQEEVEKESIELVNTLTKNRHFFGYSTDTTFYFNYNSCCNHLELTHSFLVYPIASS